MPTLGAVCDHPRRLIPWGCTMFEDTRQPLRRGLICSVHSPAINHRFRHEAVCRKWRVADAGREVATKGEAQLTALSPRSLGA